MFVKENVKGSVGTLKVYSNYLYYFIVIKVKKFNKFKIARFTSISWEIRPASFTLHPEGQGIFRLIV